MYLTITNQNIEYSYPLLCTVMDVRQEYDKATGRTQSAVNIKSGADLFTLDSLAKSSSNNYKCLMFYNGTITLVDETITESEKKWT